MTPNRSFCLALDLVRTAERIGGDAGGVFGPVVIAAEGLPMDGERGLAEHEGLTRFAKIRQGERKFPPAATRHSLETIAPLSNDPIVGLPAVAT